MIIVVFEFNVTNAKLEFSTILQKINIFVQIRTIWFDFHSVLRVKQLEQKRPRCFSIFTTKVGWLTFDV